jgi:acetyl-CoA carboxylase carboxyl transferase subunit alpha
MRAYLDFERPIAELEIKLRELRELQERGGAVDIAEEVARLEQKAAQLLVETYGRLTPWQKTQVARHGGRPRFRQCAERLFRDFTPLAGDRAFGEDAAIVGGLARFRGRALLALGHEKGDDTESRLKHNFGMARPEGYRKARRLMQLASRFRLPVVALVDTPGAYPGVDAEERGQAEAIARSTEACLELGAPLIAAIVGEGGSGGAVALATADCVLMFEHAVYSVISPEGAASILFRSTERAQDAADALKLTAQDLHRLGVIDAIVPEPVGGAHREPEKAIDALGEAIAERLAHFQGWPADRLRRHRRDKFLNMGRNALA